MQKDNNNTYNKPKKEISVAEQFLQLKESYRKKMSNYTGKAKLSPLEKQLTDTISLPTFSKAMEYMQKFNTADLVSVVDIITEMAARQGETPLKGNVEKYITRMKENGIRVSDIAVCLKLAKNYSHGSIPVITRRLELGCTTQEIEALFDFSNYISEEFGFVKRNKTYPTQEDKATKPFRDVAKTFLKAGDSKNYSKAKIREDEESIGQSRHRSQGPPMAVTHTPLIKLHKITGDTIDSASLVQSVDNIVEAFSQTTNRSWQDKPLYAKIWIACRLAEANNITNLEHLCDYIRTGKITGDFEYHMEE